MVLVAASAASCSRGPASQADPVSVPMVLPLRVPGRPAFDVRHQRRQGIASLSVPALDARTAARAAVGQRMFFDGSLGGEGQVACVRCHHAETAGAGPAQTLADVGHLDVPPLLNLRAYERFGTDGAAKELAVYMGAHLAQLSAGADIAARDLAIDTTHGGRLRLLFATADGEAAVPVSTMASRALAAYVDSLVAPGRVDAFLAGKDDALTDKESHGFDVFFERGCVSCHDGPAFGGRKMATLGLVRPWPGDAPLGEHIPWSPKRSRRVSSLRSVAVTAPYFHEGAIDSLPTAVSLMAEHQLGVTLTPEDRDAIVSFLLALNAPSPASFRAP
jgi:cytochrome c peroxidase